MILLLIGWAMMGGLCVGLALTQPPRQAMQYWGAFTAVLCSLGAFAIASQPLGQATFAGRLGSVVLRWGFKESHGRLLAATVISWLIWIGLGTAAITIVRARGDLPYRLMVLAWAVDAALLLYVVGVWLTSFSNRSAPPSLLAIAGLLVVMIAGSAALWSRGPEATKRVALVVAGGPPLVIGVGYGLFLLVALTVGRNARWN